MYTPVFPPPFICGWTDFVIQHNFKACVCKKLFFVSVVSFSSWKRVRWQRSKSCLPSALWQEARGKGAPRCDSLNSPFLPDVFFLPRSSVLSDGFFPGGTGCSGKPEPGSNLPSFTDQPWDAGQSPSVLLKPITHLLCSDSSPQDPEELCAWENPPFCRWRN